MGLDTFDKDNEDVDALKLWRGITAVGGPRLPSSSFFDALRKREVMKTPFDDPSRTFGAGVVCCVDLAVVRCAGVAVVFCADKAVVRCTGAAVVSRTGLAAVRCFGTATVLRAGVAVVRCIGTAAVRRAGVAMVRCLVAGET